MIWWCTFYLYLDNLIVLELTKYPVMKTHFINLKKIYTEYLVSEIIVS